MRLEGWRDHPLVQLTLVRYREFFREPEAVFWVFVFPVLLTAGLGHRVPKPGAGAHARGGGRGRCGLPGSDGGAGPEPGHLSPSRSPSPAAGDALRTGKVALVVLPVAGSTASNTASTPSGPRAGRPGFWWTTRCSGRRGGGDPISVTDRQVREPGSRYVDFVVPGLLGMNLMGSGIWGLGFAIVDARRKKLLKRLIATPMSRTQFLASFVLSRLTLLVIEVGVLVGFAVFGVRGAAAEARRGIAGHLCLLSSLSFGAWGSCWPHGPGRWRACRV